MSIELLEQAASALGEIRKEVVFVGGASIPMLITDPGAPAPRPTKDVDVVVEIGTRLGFEQFQDKLREQGFRNDISTRVICRWRHSTFDVVLDVMPTNPNIFGFASHWHAKGIHGASDATLPSATAIRVMSAPYLLASKIEAFRGRGKNDFLASHDFEDVVTLIDGREEIVDEVVNSPDDLRTFVTREFELLSAEYRFRDGVVGALAKRGAGSYERADLVVEPRIKKMILADCP